MALKPLPKAILIIAVVAGAGVALNFGLSMVKKTPVDQTQPVVEAAPSQSAPVQPAPVAVPEPVRQEAPPPSRVTNDASADRGLNALLNAGKR